MITARLSYKVRLSKGVRSEDLPEIQSRFPECVPELEEALQAIRARRDDGTAKRGSLLGAQSTAFQARQGDRNRMGRVVYSIQGATIIIWAAYPEHDEAYRRARARYRP